MASKEVTCPVCWKGEKEYLDCVQQLQEAASRAAAFVLPSGYDEDLALKMMTNVETYGFAFVTDREYKRAEQLEERVRELEAKYEPQ